MGKLTIEDLDPEERKAIRVIEQLSDNDKLKVVEIIESLIGGDENEKIQP